MVDLTKLPNAAKPADALAAVVALRLLADRLERKAVNHALKQNWTWAQIAAALGISRQAAHKRLARHVSPNSGSTTGKP